MNFCPEFTYFVSDFDLPSRVKSGTFRNDARFDILGGISLTIYRENGIFVYFRLHYCFPFKVIIVTHEVILVHISSTLSAFCWITSALVFIVVEHRIIVVVEWHFGSRTQLPLWRFYIIDGYFSFNFTILSEIVAWTNIRKMPQKSTSSSILRT